MRKNGELDAKCPQPTAINNLSKQEPFCARLPSRRLKGKISIPRMKKTRAIKLNALLLDSTEGVESGIKICSAAYTET